MAEYKAEPPNDPIKKFSDLVDCDPRERIKQELRILEALMAQAIRDKDFTGAKGIFAEAHKLLSHVPRPQ